MFPLKGANPGVLGPCGKHCSVGTSVVAKISMLPKKGGHPSQEPCSPGPHPVTEIDLIVLFESEGDGREKKSFLTETRGSL